jgi:hypothetical protein
VANTGALFVAIPSAGDPINDLSQEDVAHCTLSYFGDAANLPQTLKDEFGEAAEIACSEVGSFTAKVSGVAILGSDKASVLLLESVELVELRKWVNSHPAVDQATRMSEQYPNWVPHLTIGYDIGIMDDPPEQVSFDRLGLWLGETKENYDLHGKPPAPVTASAYSLPEISCREDLLLGIRYGNQVPDARWYISKRATALGASEYLPANWSTP